MASRPRLRAVPLATLLLSERRHEDRNGDTDGESHSTRRFMEGPERAFGVVVGMSVWPTKGGACWENTAHAASVKQRKRLTH